MSDNSKNTHNPIERSWEKLLAEKDASISQLEEQFLNLEKNGFSKKMMYEADRLEEDVLQYQKSMNSLKNELAESSRKFERRFDAISIMDVKPKNENKIKQQYGSSDLSSETNDFVLFRIIGNDLYPRHRKGQSRDNLRFILENEQPLEYCQKKWVVNRIADPSEEEAIISLLKEFGHEWIHIPFISEDYKEIPLDLTCLPYPEYLTSSEFFGLGPEQKQRLITAVYRLKNNYVMNNNGARNRALEEGRHIAKWVLPWDGNCFLTPRAWQRITEDVIEKPWLRYFSVPMTRVLDNQNLIEDYFQPEAVEEPQLIFRKDSAEVFNEAFCYGRRPKVELFWRLGIPGKWDRWKDDPWDQQRRDPSKEESQFGLAGWVARLYSGMGSLEQDNQNSFKQRGLARQEAIVSTLQLLDRLHQSESSDSYHFGVFDEKTLQAEFEHYQQGDMPLLQRRIDHLLLNAEAALKRGPFSVTEKTTTPPSGNIHDYWHPAPYWWPNPETSDGLPYIRRDGERVPGTRLYEEDSEKYDRTRVQRLFDDGLTLALAWYFTGDARYADHAIRALRRFFIVPDTRMNPHLQYAQVRMGHKKNQGMSTGIIEFKDFYFYLDAVRILMASPALTYTDKQTFNAWLEEYLDWLLTSPQGIKERQAGNNHGTYYDLQVASIAAFLDRQETLYETLLRAQSRIDCQIAPDGSQPEELTRATTQHYCCYNLQGWANLAELSYRWGIDLWQYTSKDGGSLKKAAQWLLKLSRCSWPFEQIEVFDEQRFYPITILAQSHVAGLAEETPLPDDPYAMKSIFFAHDGIRPYWNLGQKREQIGFTAPDKPHMFFAIPLKGKAASEDWQQVVQNLNNTLRSIQANSNKDFSIVIAGHDKPEIATSLSKSVTFLSCDWPEPSSFGEKSTDKRAKIAYIGNYIGKKIKNNEGIYVHLLDADDLVDAGLVSYVLDNDNRLGYYVDEGYKLSQASGELAETESFHTRCGSCLVGYFLKEELEASSEQGCSYFEKWIWRKHKEYPNFLMSHKRSLEILPFRAVVYVINHSESLETSKKSIKPFSITDRVVEAENAKIVLDKTFSYSVPIVAQNSNSSA